MYGKNTWSILISLFVLVCWTNKAFTQPYSYGALREETLPNWVLPAPNITSIDGVDESCDNSPNFPPISSQGAMGSCTAFAAAYYYKSYQEWQEHGWEYTSDHLFAPNFIYNMINGGADNGSNPSNAMKVICDHGVTTLSLMPYTDQNCTTFPTEEAFYSAIPYRGQDVYYFNLYASLDGLKNHLLNGNIAIFSVIVYDNLNNIQLYNNNYCLADIPGDAIAGHTITLCGFDDDRVTSDGIGAFKCANSWGSGYGENGYFWVSYQAMQSPIISWGQAYYCSDRTDYSPTLLSVFRPEHEDRYNVDYRFGIGSAASPLWEDEFFNFGLNQTTAHDYPASNIVVDLSDGTQFLTTSGSNSLFVEATDTRMFNGLTGRLMDFTVVELNIPGTASSTETPVTIPDNGGSGLAYANLDLSGTGTFVSGSVSGIWSDENSPYIVTENITIPAGSTLEIEAGTQVIFLDHYRMEVADGAALRAIGTESDPVIFQPLLSSIGWQGLRFDNASSVSRLEHCEVKYGKALGTGDESKGGGLFCRDTDLTIEYCTFTANQAVNGGGFYFDNSNSQITHSEFYENGATDGGVIYADQSSLGLSQNNFHNNTAINGSAIYCTQSNATIATNTFQENDAANYGTVHCEDDESTISGNLFFFNEAGSGGCVSSHLGSINVQENELIDNHASQGGAIFCSEGEMTVTDNNFYNNDAASGGALRTEYATITVDGNEFNLNSATGGGAMNLWFTEAEITNNSLTENEAIGSAGAMYLLGSDVILLNNLIAANTAGVGGAIYQINSTASILNCTISRNESNSSGGGIINNNGSEATLLNCIVYHNLPDQISDNSESVTTAFYSDIEDGWPGQGNIAERPWFVSQTDYHLSDWSPCIGAGVAVATINGISYSSPEYDAEGDIRPDPVGSDPDMGAYENPLGTPTGVRLEDLRKVPLSYNLYQNHPNPFNPVTAITFDIPHQAFVSLAIYDIGGRKVADLLSDNLNAGRHEAWFDASGLTSGVYFYHLSAGEFTANGKMVLMK